MLPAYSSWFTTSEKSKYFTYISVQDWLQLQKFVQSQQLDVPGEGNLAKPLNSQWLGEGR